MLYAIDNGSSNPSLDQMITEHQLGYYWNGSNTENESGGSITAVRNGIIWRCMWWNNQNINIDGKLSTTGSVNGTPQTSTLPLRIGKITRSRSIISDGYVSKLYCSRKCSLYFKL